MQVFTKSLLLSFLTIKASYLQQKNNFFCYHIKFIIIFVAKICKKCAFLIVHKEKNDKFNTYYIY